MFFSRNVPMLRLSLLHIFLTPLLLLENCQSSPKLLIFFSEIQDGGRRDLGFVGEPWDHPSVGHGLGPSMGWVGLGWVKT